MKYRRLRKGENKAPIRLSPTDLGKCPLKLYNKKIGKKEYVYTEKTLKIFEKGNRIHVMTGILRTGSKELIDTELHMTIIREDGKVIFSGYTDFIMMDDNGLYIEDLKSCNRKAFYHFFTNKDNYSEKVQVSAYRWLYYIIFGVIIQRGIITKIDRDNTLNKLSLEIDMIPVDEMEELVNNNPALLRFEAKITEAELLKLTNDFIKDNNRWSCSYCDEKKECVINKKLTLEEKEEKNIKKEKKALFKKLVE